MADVKWSALSAVTDLQDTDILALARSTDNKKITGANLKSQIIAEATNATQAELDAVSTVANAAVAKATVDAKGDMLLGTADNTVARLAAGTNGTVPTYQSGQTTGVLPQYPPGYVFDSVSITSNATSVATTAATATTAITGNSVTYDGSTLLRIIVSASFMANSGTAATILDIWDSVAGDLGKIAVAFCGVAGAGSPIYASVLHTPSAAAHVYTARLWVSGNTGTITAGAGGAGVDAPARLIVMKV